MLIGYAGGGTPQHLRQQAGAQPREMKNHQGARAGAPIWSRTFARSHVAHGDRVTTRCTTPSRTASSRRARNEAAGGESMKFYEVGPNLSMTEHAIRSGRSAFSGRLSAAASCPHG